MSELRMAGWRLLTLALLSFVPLLYGRPGLAQALKAPKDPATPAPSPTPLPVEVAPDSPRSALTDYFGLCRAGRFAEAARCLDLPANAHGRGPELARKLKAVLDRHVWLDLEKVSPSPGGTRDDGLPPELEDVGSIPTSSGKGEPVRLVRKDRQEGSTWVFSPMTVGRIDGWFDHLDDRFLLEHIPEPLQRTGPKGLLWWQWIALLALAPFVWWTSRLLGWGTRRLLVRLASRTKTRWDVEILRRLGGPFALAWFLVLTSVGRTFLFLQPPAEVFVLRVLRAGTIVALFWSLHRVLFVAREILSGSDWARRNASAPSLLSVGVKAGQVTIFTLGALAALGALGFPVGSAFAGLGIGGIALALAAQKTVENVFGSISIGIDQPLRVGDYVKVGDVQGTVETIGLRSTRIRTLDRTLVTLPNGKLADTQIETFAPRERIRLACVLGIEYGASAEQVRRVLAGVEAVLRAHPKTWQETVVVSLRDFGESSLNIEVMAWFETSDIAEFRTIRQSVLLEFMGVIESEGSRIAFPTRTLHVATGRSPSASRRSGAPEPA